MRRTRSLWSSQPWVRRSFWNNKLPGCMNSQGEKVKKILADVLPFNFTPIGGSYEQHDSNTNETTNGSDRTGDLRRRRQTWGRREAHDHPRERMAHDRGS